MKSVFVILLFTLCSQILLAQNWPDLYSEAKSSYADGDYENAKVKGEAGLADFLASDGSVNRNYAALLRILIQTHFELSEFDKAIEYGEREVRVLESTEIEDQLVFAGSYYNLASAYLMEDELEKSVEFFSKTLEIYKAELSESHYDRIVAEWKLATAYYLNSDLDEASKHFEQAFNALNSNEIDNEYLDAAYYYSNLLSDLGNYQKAEPLINTLIDVYEQNDLQKEQVFPQLLRMKGSAEINSGSPDFDEILKRTLGAWENAYGENNDGLPAFLNNWAASLEKEGHSEASKMVIAELSDARDANTLNNRATIAFNNRDYSQAADLFIEALNSLDKSVEKQRIQYAGLSENLVVLLETIGDLENAYTYQIEALTIYIETKQAPEKIGSAKSVLARIVKLRGDADLSMELYLESISEIPSQSSKYAEALNGYGSLLQQTGQYLMADSIYQLSLTASKTASPATYAAVLNNLGSFYKVTGQYLLARRQLTLALETIEEVHGINSLPYINTAQNLALLELELGGYTIAEGWIQTVKDIIVSDFDSQPRLISDVLLNEGRVFLAQGKYSQAEPSFKEVKSIRQKEYGDASPLYAESVNSLAFFYQTLGNFQEAEPLFLEALEIFKSSGNTATINYSTALENLASLYQLLGEYEKAEPLLEESLEIDRKLVGEEHPLYSTTLHNLASLYKETGKLDEAESLFNDALAIDKKVYGENHPGYAKTLYNLAALMQDKEEYEKAEQLYEEVVNIRLKLLGSNHPDYALSLFGLASIKRVLNKPEALDLYQQAIERYLFQIREYFPAMSEKEKSAFYEKIKPVFESFKDYAIEKALQGNDEVLKILYDLQLSTKALLMNSSSKVRQRILNSGDEALIKSFRTWLALKEGLVKYYTFTLEELQEEGIDIDQLIIESNELEKAISADSELFSMELDKKSVSWDDIRQSLGPNEAALEIFRIEREFVEDSIYYASLIVKPGSSAPKLVVHNFGNQLESRLFFYYKNAIKFSVGDKLSYANYWAPFEKELEGAETVYFSTDGIFNKISLNTLWNYKSDTYVIDEFKVRLVSNTREIIENNSIPDQPIENNAEVFGDPNFGSYSGSSQDKTRATEYGFSSKGVPSLPGTKIEIEKLEKSLQAVDWNTRIFVEDEASEENFKKLKSPRLLHIATHGFFMSDLRVDSDTRAFGIHLQNELANPLLRSGLLFSFANKTIAGESVTSQEDGILTAYEAMNLNLDGTELVVMSACETGLGTIRNGEGVYGLQRAFIVAGAKSVIMSLWQVDDATTQLLMNSFYSNWLGGMTKLEAFTSAQLELKKSYPDPYHWGAFVILGN